MDLQDTLGLEAHLNEFQSPSEHIPSGTLKILPLVLTPGPALWLRLEKVQGE